MKIKVTLKYKGKFYTFIDEYPDYGYESARFMWEEGNYSCDCNRSLFLIRECGVKMKELECNTEKNQIELVKLDSLERKVDEKAER